MRTSVLIPSLRRTQALDKCLAALRAQTTPPDEVLVIWQGDDVATRDCAAGAAYAASFPIRPIHSPELGVVAAENAGLQQASGELILLIDDDAVAPPNWLERHLSFYSDPSVGAVGGPAVNHHPDGTPFPEHPLEPTGRLTWYGRPVGNMYDQPRAWREREPIQVDHLVGYNLSLRRSAFDRFESGLRRYWQLFELDACLQVRARGFRLVFDFSNVVEHHPTNRAYAQGRDSDLEVKVDNSAFNHALVLSKHSPFGLRTVRWLYLMAVGSSNVPGALLLPFTIRRYGHPARELSVLRRAWRGHWQGWKAGAKLRSPRR